jgi:hypothetical protein
MMMSEELKPVRCGCGGEAYIFRGENRNWIFCVECHTESKPYETVEKAITAWNKAMSATDIRVDNKIIYCKDCKYSHMTIDGLCKYCDIWFPNEKMYVDGKFFCASAEKRML